MMAGCPLLSLSGNHPELTEMLMDGLEEFSRLFLNFKTLNG